MASDLEFSDNKNMKVTFMYLDLVSQK